MSYIVSIDGPSGSGKSSLVKRLNKLLGVTSIDTGMMYRAVAIYFFDNNVDVNDSNQVSGALKNINLKILEEENELGNKESKIYLNDIDVTSRTRGEVFGKLASEVSGIKAVRAAMVDEQRKYAKDKSIVMDGRDIGSVVFPNADVKIFLTANIEVRSKRRYKDLAEAGEKETLLQIREKMKIRDIADIEKPISPLIKTADMIEIDSTNLDIDQVVNRVLDIMKAKGLIKQ